MLKLLRKKGVAKKVIWFVAIVIIISFGFLGTAYLITGNGGTNYAGKIYGKKITVEDFNKVYQSVRIQAIRQYGYDLSKVAQILNLEAQTWDRLILLSEAKKKKIKISNNEIITAIESDKSFERNNQFDILLYNTILRNLQIRPRDYEENTRDNLKIAELYKQITSSVTINEDEVFNEYKNRNEKVQTSYIFVPFDSFKDEVTPEQSQIEKYYGDHKTNFMIPSSVDVQYLHFNFPELDESEETLEETAKENELAKIEEEKDIIREKAGMIFEQLLANPNMKEIALQNNMTVQTSGFFSMEQPNLNLGWSYDLLNKVFQMGLNEVSEPVESENNISIVQIKEKRDSYIPEFGEVQDKARDAVTVEGSKEIARQKTSEYLKTLTEELNKTKVPDFPKAAKDLALEIHQTPAFSRGQYLPQIGISKDFQETAFQLTEDNKLSGVVESEKGFCILYLDNYVPVENTEYIKTKDELASTISDQKKNTVFGDYIMQMRLEANLIDNVPQLRSQQ